MPQPLNPKKFIGVATTIADDTDEARLRTAIGRLYYGLFLSVRENLGVSGVGKSVHENVIDALAIRDPHLATQLAELKRLRNVADYELMPFNRRDQDWKSNWARGLAIYDDIGATIDALS